MLNRWCVIILWSAQRHHHYHHQHQGKGVDSTQETAIWQPLTSHTSLERQRVMQRTWWWREKSILSFRSATGLCAATARWASGLSKIHTRLAGSKASGPCVFQRKRWGKRFLWQHPCTWQCVLACLCVFAPSPPCLNIPPTPISVIFSSQNGIQPICLTAAENSTLSHLDMVLTCTGNFLSLSPHIMNTPSSAKQRKAEGLKGRRHRNKRERKASALGLLSIEPVPL